MLSTQTLSTEQLSLFLKFLGNKDKMYFNFFENVKFFKQFDKDCRDEIDRQWINLTGEQATRFFEYYHRKLSEPKFEYDREILELKMKKYGVTMEDFPKFRDHQELRTRLKRRPNDFRFTRSSIESLDVHCRTCTMQDVFLMSYFEEGTRKLREHLETVFSSRRTEPASKDEKKIFICGIEMTARRLTMYFYLNGMVPHWKNQNLRKSRQAITLNELFAMDITNFKEYLRDCEKNPSELEPAAKRDLDLMKVLCKYQESRISLKELMQFYHGDKF